MTAAQEILSILDREKAITGLHGLRGYTDALYLAVDALELERQYASVRAGFEGAEAQVEKVLSEILSLLKG